MRTYLDYFKSVLSWHYFVGAGELFQAAVAKPIDDLVLAAKTAVVQRFWQFCEDDALPWLLQNYNLNPVEAFTPAQSRQQAADAWLTWEGDGNPSIDGHRWGGAGTEEGILTEIARLGYSAAMIPVWQARYTSDGISETVTIQPTLRPDINKQFWPTKNVYSVPGSLDGEWWVDINYHWSSYYIVLQDAPFAFRRWGDPGRWGDGFWDALAVGSRVDLQRIYSTVRKFGPPEWSCRGIVFAQSGRYNLAPAALAGMAVGSTFDAWTVGAAGFAAHWNGYAWSPVPTGSTASLAAVAMDGHLAYAVGSGGTILRWSGSSWALEATPTTASLASICFAGSDIWAVGAGGVILRKHGGSWAVITSPVATDLRCVFALGVSDIWAVGAGGVSIHWDGTSWTTVATGIGTDLSGIWGASTGLVWAVGAGGVILRWNGAAWAAVASPTTSDLYAVAGMKNGRAIATGAALVAFNGTIWVAITPSIGQNALSVAGTLADNFWIPTVAGEVFNVTIDGAIYSNGRWNHFAWDDGTRYNLKYVIKTTREGWEL